MEKFNAFDIETFSNGNLDISYCTKNSYVLTARQTFGFDFIFDKKGQAVCIEINGYMSGIDGYARVCSAGEYIKLRSYLRDFIDYVTTRYTFSRSGRIMFMSDLLMSIHSLIISNKILAKRYPSELENLAPSIFTDKLLQKTVIPKICKVEALSATALQCLPKSERKNYLVKPRRSYCGKGIVGLDKLSDNAFSRLLNGKQFIVEPFIKSSCADFDRQDRFASMRLFTVCRFYSGSNSGMISIVPETIFAYQRVSDSPIVNLSKGAEAIPASKREFEKVWPLARRIISNISNSVLKVSNSRFVD